MTAVVLEDEIEFGFEELPVSSPATVYKFDEDFQSKVTALCVRDTLFMQRTEGLIRPEYFENVTDAALVHTVLRYFERYKKVPGDTTTLKALVRHDIINKVLKKEVATAVIARLKDVAKEHIEAGVQPGVFQTDISDRDFAIEQVATFARHQAVSKAILDSVEHLDMNEFEKISTTLKKALDVGENHDNKAYSYGESIDLRTKDRLDRVAGKGPITGITTGYAEIDKHMYHKGWGKRELSVIMGGAKAGKTTALIDFGLSACTHMYRHNILYVTLEVSAKIVAERSDARIANCIMFELDKHIHDVATKVKDVMSKAGRFDIVEFPSGSMRVSDLRRYLERQKSQGIKYDMICVDYADLMAPERYTDNAIENSKNVYVALRGLAMQEDIAILTATQTNREGSKKMVATMTDIAEDFNKIRIADIVISINKTDEERALGQCRLYFAAVRNGKSNFSIRLQQDIDKMRFVKEVLGVE